MFLANRIFKSLQANSSQPELFYMEQDPSLSVIFSNIWFNVVRSERCAIICNNWKLFL